ncbi:ciliary microtubule inner protein 1-like [Littorina saxatilis]|uniref:ciliary microtubule inner protein 1-like n=1 Tax=Littorina saxatilis TaxID=31220 RepID=UPI0038B60C13
MAGKGAPPQQGKAVAGCNYVAIDQIWKDHVGQEVSATKTWPDNWNFLTTKYEDLVKDEFPNHENARTRREKLQQEVTSLVQVPPCTPIEKYIKVDPSPRPFPKTTSRQIGWRSTEKSLALEKYGKYAKPKGGLVKQLKWPMEAVQ